MTTAKGSRLQLPGSQCFAREQPDAQILGRINLAVIDKHFAIGDAEHELAAHHPADIVALRPDWPATAGLR